jgi:hypothetical protein
LLPSLHSLYALELGTIYSDGSLPEKEVYNQRKGYGVHQELCHYITQVLLSIHVEHLGDTSYEFSDYFGISSDLTIRRKESVVG